MRRVVVLVLSLVVLLTTLVLGTAYGPAAFSPAPPPVPVPTAVAPTGPDREDTVQEGETKDPIPRPPDAVAAATVWALLGWTVVVVACLLLAAVVVARAWLGRSRRPRAVAPAPAATTGRPVPVLEDGQARAQREALATGSPRNGIVACWVELERSLASLGTPPRRSETPTEVTARLLAEHDVPADAAGRLLDAYRRARFSTHPVEEAERARAADALDAVHAALRTGNTP